jgi:membrane protease YdiL (CAAX protease family)
VTDRPLRPPIVVAILASVAVIVWGNALVAVSRDVGGARGEVVTLVLQPLAGLALVTACLRRGFTLGHLGLALPTRSATEPIRWLRRLDVVLLLFVLVAVAMVAVEVVVASWRGDDLPLDIVRTLVGTGIGEELLHRSALLAVWTAAVGPRTALVANMVTFGLFHVVVATKPTGFRWSEVAGPALLAVPLCIARWRTRSVVSPALGHAGVNGLAVLG